ncbi:IS3 family transposase, partial [Bacillus sp. SM2101]|uniref:IS3 family transposase n=1 Tax=Bacillus sp. SM2101 TaxID=2805366 RepID=UPI001BDEAEAF
GRQYESLEELTRELHDYVHWFNHIRNSTLGYASPIAYKTRHLKEPLTLHGLIIQMLDVTHIVFLYKILDRVPKSKLFALKLVL